jgi:ubiquitin-conjugating enzyme E2 S
MKLVLSRDYPASPPRAYFLTKIFHPNIASNGDICVNMLKRDWSPDLKLCDSLMVIRCLLIVPFPESSLNDEAAKLFMESYDEYARRARLMTRVHAWAHHSAAGGGKVSPLQSHFLAKLSPSHWMGHVSMAIVRFVEACWF